MHRAQRQHHPPRSADTPAGDTTAALYNRAGDHYLVYADGDAERLFCFDGLHAYADSQLWHLIATKLRELRATGADHVSILDAGCGPGTWVRRCVTYAQALGFGDIIARGFDVAEAQIAKACLLARDLSQLPRVVLNFDVADLMVSLPEADGSVDLTLCLYSVLSHLPAPALPRVATELARVTAGQFITTVRSIGSVPTVFVDSVEEARHLSLDHRRDRCQVEFRNGYRVAVPFHLFTAAELRDCFSPHFAIEDLHGLDIFHTRFMPDRRWNPASLVVDERVLGRLAELEERYAQDPDFIERGMHLLLVGRRRC
jgi:SAM-dependent methyltransferase